MTHKHVQEKTRPKEGGGEREVRADGAVRTFTDINDERIWAWRHVDPFPRWILDLQAGMIRRLQQLFARMHEHLATLLR